MTILSANVRNSNNRLSMDDKRKIRKKFSRVPIPAMNILTKLYENFQDISFDAYDGKNGICFLLDDGWNVIIKDENVDAMNKVWEEIVEAANEGRDEKLIPQKGTNVTTEFLLTLKIANPEMYNFIIGDENKINSDNTTNSYNTPDNNNSTINNSKRKIIIGIISTSIAVLVGVLATYGTSWFPQPSG